MTFEELNNVFHKKIVAIIVLSLLAILMFFPVVLENYFYHDDFQNFSPGNPISMLWYYMMGRPIAAWVLTGYAHFIYFPNNGGGARFFVLGTIVIMAFLLWFYMISNRIPPFKSLILVSILLTVPSVAIYAFWLTASFIVIGCIFSILSGLIAYYILENKLSLTKNIIFIIFSISFFVLAEMTYQPAGMVYWGLLAISLWHWILDEDPSWLKKIVFMTFLGISGMATYLLWYLPGYYQKLKLADQSRAIHSLNSSLEKLHNFFISVIPTVHEFWFQNPFSLFYLFIILIILSGIISAPISNGKKFFLLATYVLLLGVSFSPVLISNFPETFFRTMFPVWVVVTAYLSGATAVIQKSWFPKIHLELVFFLPILMIGIFFQYRFVNDRLVAPSVFEIKYIKVNLERFLITHPNIKVVNICPLHYKLIGSINSDEVGSPTYDSGADLQTLMSRVYARLHLHRNVYFVPLKTCSQDTNSLKLNLALDLSGMLDYGFWPAMVNTESGVFETLNGKNKK